ncbi:TPA: DUF2142 domain-containing protein [Streptococcus suis]|nr:DUF2142 domain-containing protein [Streptococcus suis]
MIKTRRIINNKLLLLFFGILIVFLSQLTLPILFEVKTGAKFYILLIGTIIGVMLIDFNNDKKITKNAFILIFTFGSVIALIRPVQYALDEESHLENAIGISDSFLFEYSAEDLKDYDSVLNHDWLRNQHNYKGDTYWYNVEHKKSQISGKPISFDNPSFLPGAIGWNLGRLISDKVYISYYLGRIIHVLTYALLISFAIKISKVYKNVIFLLGTLPAALYVIAAFHYDYLYYAASLILMAMLTNIFSGVEKITSGFINKFQLVILLFVFSKFPFVLLGSLLCVLPEKYFVSKKYKWYAILSFIPTMLFALIYSGILNLFGFTGSVTGKSPGLGYFLVHPLPIIRTMLDAPNAILENFIRQPLQYVTHTSPMLSSITTIVILISLFVTSFFVRFKLPKVFKHYTLLLLLGITFLMVFAITGDPRVYNLGDIFVGGVQGRYYFFMLCILPIYLNDWLSNYFDFSILSEKNEINFTIFLQYAMTFLVIFTVSIGFYTQI